MTLTRSSALITGASRGIGRAIALRLAEAKARAVAARHGYPFDPVYAATSLTLVVEQAGLGDSDFDGDVDLNDLGNLASAYGVTSSAMWSGSMAWSWRDRSQPH